MPTKPTKETPARIGRPPKVRPARIPAVTSAIRQAETKRAKAHKLRTDADRLVADAMRAAIAEHSLADVAAVAGISKARVHQIVRAADRRG